MITLNWIIIVKPLFALIIALLFIYGIKKQNKLLRNVAIGLGVIYGLILLSLNVDITGSKEQAQKEQIITSQNFEASMSVPTKTVKELNYTKTLQQFDKEFEKEQQKNMQEIKEQK